MNKDKQFNFHEIRGGNSLQNQYQKRERERKGEKKEKRERKGEERIYVQIQGEDHPLGLNVEQKLWCRYSNHL